MCATEAVHEHRGGSAGSAGGGGHDDGQGDAVRLWGRGREGAEFLPGGAGPGQRHELFARSVHGGKWN